jgi:hydrogenase maturation protein HypF
MDVRPALVELIARRRAGEGVERLARAFHQTIATMLAEVTVEVARQAGLRSVVLSGGCFINRLLTAGVRALAERAGLSVYTHCQVPPGDGGLSLGQAVVAASRLTCQGPAQARS